MDIRHVIAVLVRRKWYLILSLVVIGGIGIASGFILPPTYTAISSFLIRQGGAEASFVQELNMGPNSVFMPTTAQSGETFVELVQALPVLEEVVQKLQIRDSTGMLFPGSKLVKAGLLSLILPKPTIRVATGTSTYIVEVTATSPDPLEAKYLADTTVEVFQEVRRRTIVAALVGVRTDIAKRLEKAKQAFEDSLTALATYKERTGSVDIKSEIALVLQTGEKLVAEEVETHKELLECQAEIETLRQQLVSRPDPTPEMLLGDPMIEELAKRVSSLKGQRTALLTQYGVDHPEIKKIDQQIVQTQAELNGRKENFVENSPVMVQKKRELDGIKAKLATVQKAIEDLIRRTTAYPQKEAAEMRYEMELEKNRQLYMSLLTYNDKVQILEKMSLSDVDIVSLSELPVLPTSPSKIVNSIVGIFLGIAAGIGLAFLVDHLDDTVKGPNDVKLLDRVLYLGAIPKFKVGDHPLILDRTPADPVAESYRTVRNSLRFARMDKPLRTLLVTSAEAGEGKSLTSSNLAISLAREGSKVLLLDVDLRRPVVHQLFKQPQDPGLTNVLLGEAALNDAIRPTGIETLKLVTCGPIPPDPAAIVESQKLRELIVQLAEQYDWVLMDAPPLLAVNDSQILATYADATLLVLESHGVSHNLAHSCVEHLRKAGVETIVSVLNKFRSHSGRYYRYYYDYYTEKS